MKPAPIWRGVQGPPAAAVARLMEEFPELPRDQVRSALQSCDSNEEEARGILRRVVRHCLPEQRVGCGNEQQPVAAGQHEVLPGAAEPLSEVAMDVEGKSGGPAFGCEVLLGCACCSCSCSCGRAHAQGQRLK